MPFKTQREFDDFLAENVMNWSLWNGDWYTSVEAGHTFKSVRIWSPTSDAGASLQVWYKCLERARNLGYEVSMNMDDESRFHINACHPTFKRLLVIDKSLLYAFCLFAVEIFELKPNRYHERNHPTSRPQSGL